MAGDHMIHRLEFDRVNLKATRPAKNKAPEFTFPVLPGPAEPSSFIRNRTSPETELTLHESIPDFSEVHGFFRQG